MRPRRGTQFAKGPWSRQVLHGYCGGDTRGVENHQDELNPKPPGPALRFVAAALIVRGGEVLICQRRPDQPMALQWEFPGGKIEAGESAEQALAPDPGEGAGGEGQGGGGGWG